MKSLIAIILLICAAEITADELVIASGGKSAYCIVVPDQSSNERVDNFLMDTAKHLQKCIRESTEAELPVCHESQKPKESPGIYIGKTGKAVALSSRVHLVSASIVWCAKLQGKQ
jgi:hypothetical protein